MKDNNYFAPGPCAYCKKFVKDPQISVVKDFFDRVLTQYPFHEDCYELWMDNNPFERLGYLTDGVHVRVCCDP